MKSPFKPWVFVGLFIILVLSVPWFWGAETIRPFVLGLPVWAFVAFGMSLVFALFTAWTILRFWREDE